MASRRNINRRRRQQSGRWKAFMAMIVIGVVLFIVVDHFLSRAKASDVRIPEGEYTYVITPDGEPAVTIRYKGFDVSFNPDRHLPNWVAWELTADEAQGDEPRYNTFAADTDVKGSATPDDYRNTGFDRGHMAPAGDMKWDNEAMRQSFFMTNIAPQAPNLNRGSWKKLEEKCRQRASRDSAIYIVCGPVNADPVEMHIGTTGVAVPERFFKVILSPYATPPRAIGFIMPNGDTPGGMQKYAVSVDEVERITGYDFFSALPDDIESQLESTCNFTQWSQLK